jgi:hypothetical protein
MPQNRGLDLDDTSRCPIPEVCEACGDSTELYIATFQTRVGVFCLGLCDDCLDAGEFPAAMSWPWTADRVARHCEHLSCDLDDMAAAMDDDKSN